MDKEIKVLETINKKILLNNNQSSITKKAWYAVGSFFIIILLTFQKWSPIAGNWALMAFSFFFMTVALSIAIVFKSRTKKLQKLISGEMLIASWTLTPDQKKNYVNHLFKNELGANQAILFSISFIAIIVFGLFILFIPEGKLAMLGVLAGLIIFLALFAFGMPYYYRYKNNKGDGIILIGKKYAYINGFFHNWDFPLSGIKNVKIIKKPFYGLSLTYYYTDSTFTHSEQIQIPANLEVNLTNVIQEIKNP